MKKLGIIGGIGPESTIDYYRMFIKAYQEIHKSGDYPELVINSINMKKMLDLVGNRAWDDLIRYLSDAVKGVADAGAQYAIMASNTPHIVFEEVLALSPIPLVSIVEKSCEKARAFGLKKVGLLGTRFTMQTDYYSKVFQRDGITVTVPKEEEQDYIHDKIFSELQFLQIKDETREGLLSVVKRLVDEEDIQGLILGCTELPLILTGDEYGIRFLNTSQIHIEGAMKFGE